MRKVYLFLMMSGSGNRFKQEVPKQFTLVDDKPIFSYILNEVLDVSEIDDVICITNPKYLDLTEKYINDYCVNKDKVSITCGGSSRNKSILNGLKYIENVVNNEDIILIYDTTHPFVDVDGIKEVIGAVDECGIATLAEYQYDTVYEIDPNTNEVIGIIPRERVVAGASPEGFTYDILSSIYVDKTEEELEKITCAGAMALENNKRVKAVKTKKINLKITYKHDFDNYLSFKR